jgi:MraZ protein
MSLRVAEFPEQSPRRVEAQLDAEPHAFLEIRASLVWCHETSVSPRTQETTLPSRWHSRRLHASGSPRGKDPCPPWCGKVEESVEYSYLAVFKGTYRHRIDPKGRLPVPAAFRRQLQAQGASAVVATPLDQCIAVYPPAEWARLETQLRAMPAFARQVKALTRLLASRAQDLELDVQGRILLPPNLRTAASLAGEVLVIGVLDRFEIWNCDVWDSFVRESEGLLDDVASDLQWPLPGAAVTTPAEGSALPPSSDGNPQAKPRR